VETEADGRSDGASGRNRPAAVTGTALGAEGRTPNISAFRGNGSSTSAEIASAVLDTGKSFTVSAWVSPSALGRDQVVVSQDGATQSTVRLGYRPR
jgi:hypothetical protein